VFGVGFTPPAELFANQPVGVFLFIFAHGVVPTLAPLAGQNHPISRPRSQVTL